LPWISRIALDYSFCVTGLEGTLHKNCDNPMTDRLNVCEDFQGAAGKVRLCDRLEFW